MNRTAVFASLVVIVASAASATAQTTSPYAGQQQRTIKALSDQEIGDLLEGRGMGLAKAGELNSYPGPLHVMQLAEQLELADPQRAATNLLYSKMRERIDWRADHRGRADPRPSIRGWSNRSGNAALPTGCDSNPARQSQSRSPGNSLGSAVAADPRADFPIRRTARLR